MATGRDDYVTENMLRLDDCRTSVLIPIGEVARLTGVTIGTVRNWDRKGRLQSVRTPGGQRRFRLADVHAIISERAE